MAYRCILCLSIILGASCTTVKIKEENAFEAKRTISPQHFDDEQMDLEEIFFSSGDATRLNAWFLRHREARGTMLYFGGNGFLLVTSYHIVQAMRDLKLNLFMFDYRGYGRSQGRPTVAGLKEDGLAAYEYVRSRLNVDPDRLILHGHSMGAFIALYVAVQRPAAGTVLESPVTDVKDWMGRLVPWFFKPLVSIKIDPALRRESNLERIEKLSSPVLILVGKEDKVTPAAMAEKLYKHAQTARKDLRIIEDAGHNDLPETNAYGEALGQFLSDIL